MYQKIVKRLVHKNCHRSIAKNGVNYLNLNSILWLDIPVADFETPDIMNSILNIFFAKAKLL